MVKTCVYPGCSSDSRKSDIKFIQFPTTKKHDYKLCLRWAELCDKKDLIISATNWTYLCENHFDGMPSEFFTLLNILSLKLEPYPASSSSTLARHQTFRKVYTHEAIVKLLEEARENERRRTPRKTLKPIQNHIFLPSE